MGSYISSIAAFCYLEWGIIHIIAGTITIFPALEDDVSTYLINLYGGLDEAGIKTMKEAKFPRYTNRVLLQHGINLGWAGLWSCALVYGVLMKEPPRNLFLFGLVPYLLDWGYFIGLDLVKLGNGVGEAQTFIISTALACTALLVNEKHGVSDNELAITLVLPGLLAGAALANKLGLFGSENTKKQE